MTGRSRYRQLYDRLLSRVYDLYMGWYMLPFGGERRFRRKMLDGLEFRPAERLLDCTCGTGSCTAALRERVGREALLVASDLSLGQLRMASRKPALAGVPLLAADAGGLPFRDGAFDSVFLPHAVHEMPRDLRMAVFREAHRMCGRDGRMVVLELDQPSRLWLRVLLGLWFLYWIPPLINFETRTRRDLQRRGLSREVREAGFGEVRKLSKYAGTMQVVEARATASDQEQETGKRGERGRC